MECYHLKNVTFTYPNREKPALRDISLSVSPGEFLLLGGASGSGKTTLLRQLKSCLQPEGTLLGDISYFGTRLAEVSQGVQAAKIGYVFQSPENQIVTDKVWHELAFAGESLGWDSGKIRRRVAETAAFFGMESWFHREVNSLSGGQKQMLALASVLVTEPDVLLLDEPTAQLDPISAAEFLGLLGRIHRELGITVILSEHRMEEAVSYATRIGILDEGVLAAEGRPEEVFWKIQGTNPKLLDALPMPVRVWKALRADTSCSGKAESCPVTLVQGRQFLQELASERGLGASPGEWEKTDASEHPLFTGKNLWFRYEKQGDDILKGVNITLNSGEIFALLGGNGTGKSTLLRVLAGIRKPIRGEVRFSEVDMQRKAKVCLLPQNPETLFVKNTLRKDLEDVISSDIGQTEEDVTAMAERLGIEHLLDFHPYDLSGGEQQRGALAKVLLTKPDVLLLDEPTKGMDWGLKREFRMLLDELRKTGIAILMVSHDLDFCGEFADRCGLLFDGEIIMEASTREFFTSGNLYTTSAHRMAQSVLPWAVTESDIMQAFQGRSGDSGQDGMTADMITVDEDDLLSGQDGGQANAAVEGSSEFEGVQKNAAAPRNLGKTKRSPGHVLAAVMVFLAMPVTLAAGLEGVFGNHYNILSILILLECMLPMFFLFESRRPEAKEIVTIAVLCALGVIGRSVFFAFPQFKPVAALVIIAGVSFGSEVGFLVGAVTMLASNVMFSQGPWTPWQMFAMGILGFLAGLIFRKGGLPRKTWVLAAFGGISTLVLYGGIMNFASAILWNGESLNFSILVGYFATGFPMDLVHGISTVLFLWLGARPMMEKLDRLKVKYGVLREVY